MTKKILIYDSYSNKKLPTGGSNRSLLLFLEHRKKRDGIEYFFLTNQVSSDYYRRYVKKLNVRELNVAFPEKLLVYGKEYESGLLKQLSLFASSVLPFNIVLAKELRRTGIDLVVCNEGRATLTIGLAARLAGVKCMTFIRTDRKGNSMLSCIMYSLSSKLICISEGMYNNLPTYAKKKAVIARHGIPLANHRKSEHKGIVITNIANITPLKNQLVLLKALKLLASKHDNLSLRLLGKVVDNEYYNSLVSFVESEGLGELVSFLGFVNDVDKHLSVTDIYVQQSDYEGLGRSIMEAYLHEIPVIGSNIPGIMSIVRNQVNGLIFEKGNEVSLAERIDYLIGHPNERKRMGKLGRQIVENEFSMENNVREIEKAFNL